MDTQIITLSDHCRFHLGDEPDAWQAVWDAEIAPQMTRLIKKPGYSM